MDELEVLMLVASAVMAFWGVRQTFVLSYHPLFFQNNPGLGASRAAVWIGWAAFFALRFGYQPVALFNNWPHPKGVVPSETVSTALAELSESIKGLTLDPSAPPFFMVQSGRLDGSPMENDFDNRYFISEEDLPTSRYLLDRGIREFYYVHPSPVEADDLNPYLTKLAKEGIRLLYVDPLAQDAPVEKTPVSRETMLSNFSLPRFAGFRRSMAGGFGALIPPRSTG